jgi:hypothetical protein
MDLKTSKSLQKKHAKDCISRKKYWDLISVVGLLHLMFDQSGIDGKSLGLGNTTVNCRLQS